MCLNLYFPKKMNYIRLASNTVFRSTYRFFDIKVTRMAEKCASVNDGDCPPAKKVKLDDGSTDMVEKNLGENDRSETELDLSSFKVTRVLQNNCARKLICMEGTFKDRDGSAVVLLEQKSFPYDKVVLEKDFFDGKTLFRKIFTNDVYRNYNCFPTEEHNSTSICFCRCFMYLNILVAVL